MKHDIDALVNEICAAYPELTKDTVLVRQLVAELVANQPNVSIDTAFKNKLRATLLLRAAQHPTATRAVPRWLAYIVPVGVMAILLVLVQPRVTTQPPSVGTGTVTPPAASIQMESAAPDDAYYGGTMLGDSPQAKMAAPVPSAFPVLFTSDHQAIVVEQLTLEQPGFIVLTGQEGVVAVSGLLGPGAHVQVVVPLQRPVLSGTSYLVGLYLDDGDRGYIAERDPVAYDPAGTPLVTQLVAP